MTTLTSKSLELLSQLEREEIQQLCWGCVDAYLTEEEVRSIAQEVLEGFQVDGHDEDLPFDEWELVVHLLENVWLWETPDGLGYRTRLAEGVRLFARLRQIFPNSNTPNEEWRTAPGLVADYRLLVKPRQFPRRDTSPIHAIKQIRKSFDLSALQEDVFRSLVRSGLSDERQLSGFQIRATTRILSSRTQRYPRGTIACAGTGSGKTLAFYIPAFLLIAENLGPSNWTKCIALYPRNELLKDQLIEALSNARQVLPVLKERGKRPVLLGALNKDVPKNCKVVLADPEKGGWQRSMLPGSSGRLCPFVKCPECTSQMVWREEDIRQRRERLICTKPDCSYTIEHSELCLTRERMFDSPPDILFASSEMMNRNLGTSRYSRLFGLGLESERRPFLMLLDEVHTYGGTQGAHVACLLRRWLTRSGSAPHVVGLSATLEDSSRFLGDLVGIPATRVEEISPREDEILEEGAEYQLALRGDPATGTALLSTSIQSLMLLRRLLGVGFAPFAGSRVFAFCDKLDIVNRLFHSFLDAEGRTAWGAPMQGRQSLASLRASENRQQAERFVDGQSWDIVQDIGHHLDPDNRLSAERVSSQDPGVLEGVDVVVASSSLEVGYDDPQVGAVLQHKAPMDAAGFLQRKGRGGRARLMRPWTVVVLSDYGRDRLAYNSYEQLFSPVLVPRYLPLANRSVLRMQATYALFEWLGCQVEQSHEVAPWSDLAHSPGGDRPLELRQAEYVPVLTSLLESRDKQNEFAGYLQKALKLDNDEVQALMWEPPRSIILEAVPTLLRRLETDWQRPFGAGKEPQEQWGPPLPDFVQKTLFGELLVPDVRFAIPETGFSPSAMPVSQALTEFSAGKVSRRFGFRGDMSHWVDPGAGPRLFLDSFCPEALRDYLGEVSLDQGDGPITYQIFRPVEFRLATPPADVSATSNAFPIWRTIVDSGDDYHAMELPVGSVWNQVLRPLRFHTHHLGCPIELRRFTIGSRVSIKRQGQPHEERQVDYSVEGEGSQVVPAALGFSIDVDAVEVPFRYPKDIVAGVRANPPLERSLRPGKFKDLLIADHRLNGVLNHFQRNRLAEAFLAAVSALALENQIPIEKAVDDLISDEASTGICDALSRVLLWAPNSHDDSEVHPASHNNQPRILTDLNAVLGDGRVKEALRDAASALYELVREQWESWLREKYKATLSAGFLQAIMGLCNTIDQRSLIADPSDGHDRSDSHDDRFWITETSIGGAGALELFYREYAKDPRRFLRHLDSALGPSDLENVSLRFEALLEALSGPQSSETRNSIEDVRGAVGRRNTMKSMAQLRRVLADQGIVPDPSLLISINARLLRPGCRRELDDYLASILRKWNDAEAELGIEVDSAVIAYLECHKADLEKAIGILPPGGSEEENAAWRYSALRGLLWARGSDVRRESLRLDNVYVDTVSCDRLLVKSALENRVFQVSCGDELWFKKLEKHLSKEGVAELVAGHSGGRELSDALLNVASCRFDTGGLLVHARLTGVRRELTGWIATLELPEVVQ